jgi:hypothetical protein
MGSFWRRWRLSEGSVWGPQVGLDSKDVMTLTEFSRAVREANLEPFMPR